MGIPVDKVFEHKLEEPTFRKEYAALQEEFVLARDQLKAQVEVDHFKS